MILGDPAVGEAAPGVELDLMFLYDGSGSPDHYRSLCERSLDALRALSRDNLLLSPIPVGRTERAAPFPRRLFGIPSRQPAQPANCWNLPARAVFSHPVMPGWEKGLRIRALKSSPMAPPVMRCWTKLRPGRGRRAGGRTAIIRDHTGGGLGDVERAAAYLTVTHAATAPEVIAAGTVSVFQGAGERELIPEDTAQRLAEAARMWRNLRGILRLLAVG